jgi:hypothetical protein
MTIPSRIPDVRDSHMSSQSACARSAQTSQWLAITTSRSVIGHAIRRPEPHRPAADPDGDLQMLEWMTAGACVRLALFVHDADATREFASDR